MTYSQQQPAPTQAPQNTLGLISLILGIASIPFACCFGSGILFGIAGAVLGYMGKQKAAQGLATNGGQANAGFVCGIIGTGIGVLWIIATVVLNVAFLPGNLTY